MTIATAAILVDGTAAVTGGTSTGLISLGDEKGTVETVLDDSAAYVDQTAFNFTAKQPKASASAPSGYTARRRSVYIKIPKALANGLYTFDSIRIEGVFSIETTDAEILSAKVLGVNAMVDTALDLFWQKGSSN